MKTCTPEYIITLIDAEEGEEEKTLETCRHPGDVHGFLTNPNKPAPSRVSVAEYDWSEDELMERLNGEEWLEKYCVLEPARWRLR